MGNRTRSQAPPVATVEVPPPSSLCPQCGCVEVDAYQYRRGTIDEILYACDRNHGWLVRWIEVP